MSVEQGIVILGAGGHASVVAELLLALNKTILGFIGPDAGEIRNYPQIAYLGNDQSFLSKYSPRKATLVNGLGATTVKHNEQRHHLFDCFKDAGYVFESLVHPAAVVASTAQLEEGCQIMAGAIIQPNAIIGANSIINTRASIDHDCKIGHSVHVAPGCVLSGNIAVGDNALIGVGATLIQGLIIGEKAMVCAGCVVVNNIQTHEKFRG